MNPVIVLLSYPSLSRLRFCGELKLGSVIKYGSSVIYIRPRIDFDLLFIAAAFVAPGYPHRSFASSDLATVTSTIFLLLNSHFLLPDTSRARTLPRSNDMPSLLSKSGGNSRFELPALNLNFGSITDGTNIPPPPDSPVQKAPTPPQTPPPGKTGGELGQGTVKGTETTQSTRVSPTNGNLAGTKRLAEDEVPLSPATSSRQGSIRRLFSRTMLNNSYAEGQSTTSGTLTPGNISRPESRSGGSFMDERRSKRTSGWFRRLSSRDSVKRSSMIYEEPPSTPKKSSGPPPPMIPELKDLEKDEGSLGADLFKNIK